MKRVKLHLFALCAILALISCGSDKDPVLNDDAAIYEVVLEASGDDYIAEAIIINPDKVSIIEGNTDLKQSNVNAYFKGVKRYSTSSKVTVISIQGIIVSKTGATLKMTVYKDGKEVYKNAVTVPEYENNTKSIVYSSRLK